MVKELPAFLRPCRVQLFYLRTIAALEPERQAGRIALTVVFRVQHPLTVGTVLNTVQMQQPIEHLGSAAVLFGDLRGCYQRIRIAQLCFIAAPARCLLMQQAEQRIPVKRLRMVRRADCRMVQFAELLCHVLRNTVVFHIPLDRTSALILEPNAGHILVVAALDETILAHTRKPLAEITANIKDYVIDGKTGYLCSPRDADAFADKIQLLSDKEARFSMRKACVEKAEEFRLDISHQQMKNIYKNLLREQEKVK